jgi:hypothetical protein
MQVEENHARQGIMRVQSLVLDEFKRTLAIRGDLNINSVPLVCQGATQQVNVGMIVLYD